jgi:hypothetical protein
MADTMLKEAKQRHANNVQRGQILRIATIKKKLEPYWRFALRINTWVNGTQAASKRAEEVASDVPAPAGETRQPAASGKQETDCDATKAAQTIVPSVDIEATQILAADAFTHDDASSLTTAMEAMSQILFQ